jgi:hypothetical protein
MSRGGLILVVEQAGIGARPYERSFALAFGIFKSRKAPHPAFGHLLPPGRREAADRHVLLMRRESTPGARSSGWCRKV